MGAARLPVGVIVAVVGGLGCDLPPPRSPTDETLSSEILEPSNQRLPRDGTITILVDGLLDPASLYGVDATLTSGDRELGMELRFDPATRLLVADPTAPLLDPDLSYTMRVSGPHDFDGRALAPIEERLRVTRLLAVPEPAPSFEDVARVLARCAGCHEGPTAALGLDLTDLPRTAIGVRSVELGPSSFGRDGTALRIEPGHPERSYLVYKMLGEGPITGAPMGAFESPDVPLPREEIAIVSRWIAAGAVVPDRERP